MGVLCFGEVKHKSLTNTLQTIMWEKEMVWGKVYILKAGGLGPGVYTKGRGFGARCNN